jgi:N-acyl homoserine lactone hydrolase
VRVYVQKEELSFAHWPPVYQRDMYVRADFDGVRNWQQLRAEHDIFNDGRLVIFPTPGHTPGHQSLLVKLDRQAYILAGAAVYDKEKMQARCLPGVLWNPDALIESWERIEELQRRHDAALIVTHDIHWAETVKLAPGEWYE